MRSSISYLGNIFKHSFSMGRKGPGYRFNPTDVELVMYYLKRKVLGKKLRGSEIVEVDIY